MAELCQGNLIPTHANKMVPSGAAQITTWKLATVQAMEKVTCGMDVSETCCAGLDPLAVKECAE